MKSPLIVTLTIAGVLVTGTAAIAVNSSAFKSVEQSRLGNQSALLAPQDPSTAAAPALPPEPGETSTPAPDAGTPPIPAPAAESPTAGSKPETYGVTGEAAAPASAPERVTEPAPRAETAPVPAKPPVVSAPIPASTPAPAHRDDGYSNEDSGQNPTEHDD